MFPVQITSTEELLEALNRYFWREEGRGEDTREERV